MPPSLSHQLEIVEKNFFAGYGSFQVPGVRGLSVGPEPKPAPGVGRPHLGVDARDGRVIGHNIVRLYMSADDYSNSRILAIYLADS